MKNRLISIAVVGLLIAAGFLVADSDLRWSNPQTANGTFILDRVVVSNSSFVGASTIISTNSVIVIGNIAGNSINAGANTNMFVVESNGNTRVARTLTVTGASTLTGVATLTASPVFTSGITGPLNIGQDTNKVTIATNGATLFASTVGITGAATLSSTLGVTGLTTPSGGILYINAGQGTNMFTVATNGDTKVAGTATITGLATLTGGASLVAASSATTNFTVGGRLILSAAAVGTTTNAQYQVYVTTVIGLGGTNFTVLSVAQ